jgi:hypothetical protein
MEPWEEEKKEPHHSLLGLTQLVLPSTGVLLALLYERYNILIVPINMMRDVCFSDRDAK